MRLSREVNIIINYLINEVIPPFLRDSRWIMKPLFYLAFGKNAGKFLDFHQQVYTMGNREFALLNADVQPSLIDRPTDLNRSCIDRILQSLSGDTVLEVGCGKGYLSRLLSQTCQVTGVDIALPPTLQPQGNFRAAECSAEYLPFADKSFDTVICAHTLEHVRDIQKTLSELRRVCRRRMIIVVPCERPYRYTFNLHIHFFPYAFSVLAVTGTRDRQSLTKAGGDWVYTEEQL